MGLLWEEIRKLKALNPNKKEYVVRKHSKPMTWAKAIQL